MICPVFVANEMSGLKSKARIREHSQRRMADALIPGPSFGTGNEDQRSFNSSDEWTDHLDAGADIIGITDRSMRRWRVRLEQDGYDGLYDRRKRRPSPKRVALATVEKVLRLYRETYYDLNVKHFVEKLHQEHQMELSYT